MDKVIDLYSDVKSFNPIELCRPLIDKGWYLDTDDRLKAPSKPAIDIPWVFAVQDDSRKCNLWHGIFFNLLGLLPSPCLQCWKVVVRPQTLEDLFELHEIQKEMGWPSKCGIEIRRTVCGLYGGYFYTDSKPQGQKMWSFVRHEVDQRLWPETSVILKRGCTEFEHHFGNSAKWDELIDDNQIYTEKKLDSFIDSNERLEQPKIVKRAVFNRWIEWAFRSGDMTYLKFTGNKSLVPGYKTYHEETVELEEV